MSPDATPVDATAEESQKPAPSPEMSETSDQSSSAPVTDESKRAAIVQGALAASTGRAEVSAATIGRMLGLATTLELKVVEQKIDLVSTKLNTMAIKVDKLLSNQSSGPTGADLERIDLQIGQLKTMLREILTTVEDGSLAAKEETR